MIKRIGQRTIGMVSLALAAMNMSMPARAGVDQARGDKPADGQVVAGVPRAYKVEPIPVRGIVKPRTEEQERAFQDAAAIIAARLPVPEDRIQFFRWMRAENSLVIPKGWHAFVQDVTRSPEGNLITIRVSSFATLKDGGHVTVHNNFLEEYLWSNGQLKYVRGYCCPILGKEPSMGGL